MSTDYPSQLAAMPELQALVTSANAGDPAAIRSLRKYLKQHPEIWQSVGDLAKHAQEALIRIIAGSNSLLAESLRQQADKLRKDLSGDDPTTLEELAVERVVACWFELQFAATKYPADAGTNLQMARFVVQLKESAQRRFDAAMRSLILVREKRSALRGVESSRRKILKLPIRVVS